MRHQPPSRQILYCRTFGTAPISIHGNDFHMSVEYSCPFVSRMKCNSRGWLCHSGADRGSVRGMKFYQQRLCWRLVLFQVNFLPHVIRQSCPLPIRTSKAVVFLLSWWSTKRREAGNIWFCGRLRPPTDFNILFVWLGLYICFWIVSTIRLYLWLIGSNLVIVPRSSSCMSLIGSVVSVSLCYGQVRG